MNTTSPNVALPGNKRCHRDDQNTSGCFAPSHDDDFDDYSDDNEGFDWPDDDYHLWIPSNDVDTETGLSDVDLVTENDSRFLPSLDNMCSEFENRVASSFMKKSPKTEDTTPNIFSRIDAFRHLRKRGNSEDEPIEIESDADDDSSLPDLPEAQEQEVGEENGSTPGIVAFAAKRKQDIEGFLSSHKLETQRRPCVTSFAQWDQFKHKHPGIHAKMKARLQVPDGDLYALNDYLCDVYSDQLRGNGPAFIMMQKLEDIVDFVVKMYHEN